MMKYLLEFILHWLLTIPGITLLFFLLLSVIIFNPLLWPFFLIYLVFIIVKLPNTKEIDYWVEIRNNYFKEIPLNSTIYNRVFKTVKIKRNQESQENKENQENQENKEKGKIYTMHTHGLQSISHFIHKFNKDSELYPELSKSKSAVHSILFHIPFIRELIIMFGCIPANKKYIKHYLENGVSVCLTPGGVTEMQFCQHNQNKEYIYIKSRKGFIELSKSYELIPIYIKGEQDFFTFKERKWEKINKFLGAIAGHSVDLNIFQTFSFHNLLKWLKVYTNTLNENTIAYIGPSIMPSEKTIDQYIEHLNNIISLSNESPIEINKEINTEINKQIKEVIIC